MTSSRNKPRPRRQTYTGDLQEVPELPLPLVLHLHHRGVGIFDVLQRLFDSREQVDDLLLADQDLTGGEEGGEGGGGQRTPVRHQRLQPSAAPT